MCAPYCALFCRIKCQLCLLFMTIVLRKSLAENRSICNNCMELCTKFYSSFCFTCEGNMSRSSVHLWKQQHQQINGGRVEKVCWLKSNSLIVIYPFYFIFSSRSPNQGPRGAGIRPHHCVPTLKRQTTTNRGLERTVFLSSFLETAWETESGGRLKPN